MTKASRLVEKIFKNWLVKLICFVIAILLYIFHQTSLIDKRSFVLPIDIQQEGIVMPVGDYTKNVTVTIRANVEEITSVHPSQIRVYANLDNITKSGEYTVPVNVSVAKELMRFDPFEIKVKPESIKINVEKKGEKYIQIEPSIVGEPAHGYSINKVEIEPSFVKISGPEKMLQEINNLQTEMLDITNITKNMSEELEGLPLSKIITIDDEGPYSVNVVITPDVMQKKFTGFVVQPVNLSENFEINNELPVASLVIEGIVPLLENFNLNAYSVQVDLSQINEAGSYELPVKYVYPSYFKLVEKTVDKVTVEIVKIEKEEILESVTDEMTVSAEN